MLLHKRHALRKAFSKMADVNPEEPLEALGSRTEYEARKQMSFPVFHKLLKEFRPTTTPKVWRDGGTAFCFVTCIVNAAQLLTDSE